MQHFGHLDIVNETRLTGQQCRVFQAPDILPEHATHGRRPFQKSGGRLLFFGEYQTGTSLSRKLFGVTIFGQFAISRLRPDPVGLPWRPRPPEGF
jgi:hypothetical protein